jgi:adenylate cyclase
MTDALAAEDKALALEITKSEILRIRIIVITFAVMFCGSFVFYLISAEKYDQLFQGRVKVGLLPAFFGSVAAFYTITLTIVSLFARKGKNLPLAGRLFNATMEGVIPSFALWLLAPVDDIAAGLAMPPLFAYGFFVILSVMRLNPLICIMTGVSGAITYLFFVYHLLGSGPAPYNSLLFTLPNHYIKAAFILGASIIAGFVAYQLRKRVLHVIDSVRQKQELETLFGEHVSQEVVQKLVASKGDNLAEIRHITALFLDIRSFTTFSESRSAHEVYTELNKLLDFMIDIVHEHSGIINKFLGDGFLAVFGAPLDDDSHAVNAVKTARKISEQLKIRAASGTVVNLGIGIGIHSGEALTGNVGSDKRKEYTVIGDVINVASRIEQLNKQFKSEILVSEEVIAAGSHGVTFAEKGEVPVKGREKPVRVFSLA